MDGSDEFFRQIVQSSLDGIWAFDLAGRTTYANARAAELLGRSPEEMAALTVFDVLDQVGQEQFREHLVAVREVGPNGAEVECTYLRADGSPAHLLVSERALLDAHGVIEGYVHRLTDHGDRRALLDELSTNRERLDEAQTLARVGSWEMDLETREVRWSRYLFEMLGLDPATVEPSADRFVDAVLDRDREGVRERVRRLGENHEALEFDARVARTDGTVRWVRGLGRTQFAGDGTPVSISGTIQDITPMKEVELQLVDAVILNALMQVMATSANEAETLAEALEVTRHELLAHDDWGRAVAFLPVTAEDGTLVVQPYLVDADPARVPTELEQRTAERALVSDEPVFEEEGLPETPSLGFTLRLGGEVLLVVVITALSPFERHAMLTSMCKQVAVQLTRVAERERAAQELEAARDTAMEASRLKSEFLATMSHEIRTPMNGVIGLNELMLRTSLDDHQRRLAHGAQVAGRALMSLINDILDFSKIEAGQLEIEVVEFEVRPVIDQVLAINGQTAHDRGVTLDVEVDEGVPDRLVGDPTRLGQVVGNLVSNAVKFTSDGTVHITLRTEATRPAEPGSTLRLRVEVADTGIGIDRDGMERLFEPFRQADVSTTRTFGGTGLGLAISRQLVEAMGGEIGVASTTGEGSTFWFTALFDPVGEGLGGLDRTDAARLGDDPRHTGNVLVVEDNDINQLVALGLLEALGFTADVAANGEEAIAKVSSGGYDVVLMDLQMPGMDGYTASRLIRSHEPEGLRVPIIAMTASAIEGVRERCLEAGMDDFLTKPVSSEHLESMLRAQLRTAVHPTPEPPPQPPPPAVLDESRLEELGELGPAAVALVERAVDNFVAGMDGNVNDIEKAVAGGESETLSSIAHRLKGSALNLGANRLAEICLELELLGEEGAAWGGAPMIDELKSAAAATVSALLDYRSRQPQA